MFASVSGVEALRTSEDTEFRSLRAYVSAGNGIYGFRLVHYRDHQPITAELELENSGETPAFDVHVYMNAVAMPSFLTPDFSIKPPMISNFGMLGKHATMSASKNTAENDSRDERLSMVAGVERIYVFGEITYRDTFSHQHETDFCDFFQGGSTEDLVATTCPQHTSAD